MFGFCVSCLSRLIRTRKERALRTTIKPHQTNTASHLNSQTYENSNSSVGELLICHKVHSRAPRLHTPFRLSVSVLCSPNKRTRFCDDYIFLRHFERIYDGTITNRYVTTANRGVSSRSDGGIGTIVLDKLYKIGNPIEGKKCSRRLANFKYFRRVGNEGSDTRIVRIFRKHHVGVFYSENKLRLTYGDITTNVLDVEHLFQTILHTL